MNSENAILNCGGTRKRIILDYDKIQLCQNAGMSLNEIRVLVLDTTAIFFNDPCGSVRIKELRVS